MSGPSTSELQSSASEFSSLTVQCYGHIDLKYPQNRLRGKVRVTAPCRFSVIATLPQRTAKVDALSRSQALALGSATLYKGLMFVF